MGNFGSSGGATSGGATTIIGLEVEKAAEETKNTKTEDIYQHKGALLRAP